MLRPDPHFADSDGLRGSNCDLRLVRAIRAVATGLVTGSIPALTCADVCRCLSLVRRVGSTGVRKKLGESL